MRQRISMATLATIVSLAAVNVARAVEDDRPVVDDSKTPTTKAANAALPTLFVVGDSTANSNAPLRGWGSEIGAFFDASKINVVNRAIGGRSSRTYFTEGRWAKVLAELKPGDVVLIQFGHNDVGSYTDPKAKGRPSIREDGEATTQALNADGKTIETIHTFGWYMRQYASDATAKGATPILLSMVPHKDWTSDGKIKRGERDSFVKWTQADAKATGALFVDANEIIAEGLEREGQSKVESFFGDARTHSTPAGAKYNAAGIALGLKSLTDSPLTPFFSNGADAFPPTLQMPKE